MSSDKPDLTRTEEVPTRKISLTKLGVTDRPKKRGVIGWECDPPEVGRPYRIYLYEGMVLRTSLVKEVQKTRNALIVSTLNSVYQIKYIKEEQTEPEECFCKKSDLYLPCQAKNG